MQQEQEGLAPQKSLNDDDRQNLNERLDPLQGMLDLFPDVSVEEPPEQDLLAKTEAWSRKATVAIFNIFNMLAPDPLPHSSYGQGRRSGETCVLRGL